MHGRSLLLVLLCVLLISGAAFAQSGNITNGSISGRITDNSGGVLPGVTVTATNAGTGLARTATTASNGDYSIPLLPPGKYKVEAELAGLGKARNSNVTVVLGNDTKIDIKLTPQVSEELTVTAAAPVVDVQKSGTSTSVSNEQIESLPLIGRDFRSLAALTPGITLSAFDGSLTANGARGLSTDFNIDGANSDNDFFGQQTGGTRAPFTFSQAAIKEFQVIRTQYDAEYGRGVGATINAITKSGTNDTHGTVFYFRRDKNWASDRPLTMSGGLPITESFRSKDSSQPGFAVGGPILRDRIFYFANFDGQRQSLPVTIGTDIRQSTQFLALTSAQQQAVLAKIQSIAGAPYESGLNYSQTFNQNTYLVKFDGDLGSKNHWSLRDNLLKFTNKGSQSTTVLGLNQTQEIDKFNQAVLEGDTIFTNNLYNQFIGQIGRDQRPVTALASGTEVSLSFGGSGSQFIGQNDITPNTADEKKYQFKDTVQYLWNGHTIKGGVELLHRHLFDSFPRFVGGLYSYSNLTNFINEVPNTFQQAYGVHNGDVAWDTNLWGVYFNDSFHIGTRLTIDAGLRYDYEKTPRPPSNAFPQHPEFLSQIRDDKNNYAPRFGFAYDVFGDGRSVLRGGSGKFFSYMPDILLASPIQGISGALLTTTFTCTSTASNPCPTYPNIMSPSQFLSLSKLSANLVTIGPNYQAQEAWRSSLQFEHRLGQAYSAGVSAVYSKLTHVQGTKNINLVPTGVSLGNLPIYDYSSSTNPGRPYTDMGIIREITSNEQAWYRAATLEFHKLAINNSKLSWDLSYTRASSWDQDTNGRSTSTTFLFDPNNPKLSEGPSDNDIKNRIVGDLTYRLPWGFQLSVIGFWHSGLPYNGGLAFTCSGCAATSLSGQAQTTGNIPLFADSSGNIIDLKSMIGSGLTKAQFSSALAAVGGHLIGRNTFRQASVMDSDVRLAKFFNLPRGMQVELVGEVFNVLNKKVPFIPTSNQNRYRVTYTQSTDKYTVSDITANLNGNTIIPFGIPQGYSFEADPRQFQVAAKFIF
ncbi:MAG TPA: carboxypeptidase regulatory-like domain-containing protein [Thermoanaerobaculia bacterium]|nr:carboxypeptidase regulatory-like domain-containing protein [Thermoanaerobaculia bacterium]